MIEVSEVFATSLSALRRNKTRSMLTALGIIIGVTGLVCVAIMYDKHHPDE